MMGVVMKIIAQLFIIVFNFTCSTFEYLVHNINKYSNTIV